MYLDSDPQDNPWHHVSDSTLREDKVSNHDATFAR